MTTAGGIL